MLGCPAEDVDPASHLDVPEPRLLDETAQIFLDEAASDAAGP
jgi:hypothetical protein